MNMPKRSFLVGLLLPFVILLVSVLGFSQVQPVRPAQDVTVQALKAVDQKLNSKLMGREMPYRVVLPRGYDDKVNTSVKYPVIYLLHGLSGNYTNWTDRSKLLQYANDHKFIIVTPEGANGWYSDSVSIPTDRFETYIVNELIPEIEKKYRTFTDRDHRVIGGLSMGGYGALKFGLKYPEMFSLAGSFSGALGAAAWTEKVVPGIGKSIDAILGPDGSDARTANDIFRFIREIAPEKLQALPFIYQSCGTEDFLIKFNRDYLALLNEKKVPHEYREHPGIHDLVFWDDQIREFLDLAERRMKK